MHTNNPMMRWFRLLVFCFSFLFISGNVFAHPMGNFSINHYAKITVGERSIDVLYLVDIAEIPTYQEMRQFGLTNAPSDTTDLRYLNEQDARLKGGLTLEIDGQTVNLATISRQIVFADGAGGLTTMKLSFAFRANVDVHQGTHKLSYADNNFPGRAGWKEIVVLGDGATILGSTASNADRSQELTNYSADLLNSPPQQLAALVNFATTLPEMGERRPSAAAGGPVEPAANLASIQAISARKNQSAVIEPSSAPKVTQTNPVQRKDGANSSSEGFVHSEPLRSSPLRSLRRSQNTPRSRFTELISTQSKLSFWVLLSAGLIAAGLGTLHALEPGHGKTIVAAYLVGSRGTARHAVLLGFVVTAAHTAGVYLLGIVTLYASRYIVPEQLYPWLGVISGLSVTGLGVFIFLKHLTGESGGHSHASGEQHSHWFLSMFKPAKFKPAAVKQRAEAASPVAASPDETRAVSLRELCLLGITGGIVPCPAALVVLLSAFSLHRIGFGLFLITAFSFGLATVLVIVGLTMVYTKRFMASRIRAERSVVRYLPLLSSAFMVVLGVGIAISAVASAPVAQGLFSKANLLPFVTVTLLGLFLGMRHSTDPDHVVAVSTIVSRQQSIKGSVAIGLLWGLGHTLTIFLVGSAIIIFGVVIPPRIGLSMEFCVALMLILLGMLNLTGALRWITERFTPAETTGDILNARTQDRIESDRIILRENAFLDRVFGRLGLGELGLYHTLRPLFIGLVHGLAGSAAVALLVLSTIKNPFWSTAYLVVFGVGTMAGMMLMTAAISLPLVFTARKFSGINRHLAAVSGLASLAFGIFLVYHIGFVDGLFTSHVHWIPQ